jgi:hypothetical protein
MLPQKVLINVGVDVFTGAIKNYWTLLAVAAYPTQDHLLQWSLGFWRDVDVGIHVGYREVCQVAAVAAVDSHIHSEDLLIRKNPDLARLAGLSLLMSFWRLSFLVSWASVVRSGRWTITRLSSPRSSFTRCLVVLGSIL